MIRRQRATIDPELLAELEEAFTEPEPDRISAKLAEYHRRNAAGAAKRRADVERRDLTGRCAVCGNDQLRRNPAGLFGFVATWAGPDLGGGRLDLALCELCVASWRKFDRADDVAIYAPLVKLADGNEAPLTLEQAVAWVRLIDEKMTRYLPARPSPAFVPSVSWAGAAYRARIIQGLPDPGTGRPFDHLERRQEPHG